MIADWTVDIGPESPWIVVPWAGWVDLRLLSGPSAPLATLAEVRAFPELGALLELANIAGTCTSKVDVFPVSRDEVDPEIAEAGPEQSAAGLGSYLDLLATQTSFSCFEHFEAIARQTARDLNRIDMPLTCAEIVVRPAQLYDRNTFGWTLYAMGFGPDKQAARRAWSRASMALQLAFQQAVLPGPNK